jgi:hypothetical protein
MCTDTCACANSKFDWTKVLVWGTALLLVGAMYWFFPQLIFVVIAAWVGIVVHTWWTVDLPKMIEQSARLRKEARLRQPPPPKVVKQREPFDVRGFVRDALRAFKRLGFIAAFVGVLMLFYGGLWKAGTAVASLFA